MGHPATAIRFCRTDADSSRILANDEYVGDVYADDDILRPGHRIFSVHLFDDARGPRPVHDRSLVRATAQHMLDTLPWR